MITDSLHASTRQLSPEAPIRLLVDPETLLIDTAFGIEHSLAAALDEMGLPRPVEGLSRYARMARPLPELVIAVLGAAHRDRLPEFFTHFVADFHHHGRYLGRLRAGSTRLLANLAADPRYDLHYLSHIGTEAATKLLDTYGLQHVMRSVITTEMPGCPGMRLHLLKEAVEQESNARSSWMLISDHPWELVAADRLGIRAIALGYGRAPLDVLVGYPAEVIAGTLDDVGSYLLDDGEHANVVRLIPRSRRLH